MPFWIKIYHGTYDLFPILQDYWSQIKTLFEGQSKNELNIREILVCTTIKAAESFQKTDITALLLLAIGHIGNNISKH